jgi:hypothetical protein
MTTTSTSEHHDCAHSQCQHVVAYSDERYCYLHEPPVFDNHNCVVLNCENWKTGETFRPLEQPVLVAAGPSYSEQVLADAKAEAAKLADDWDWPLPNDDF